MAPDMKDIKNKEKEPKADFSALYTQAIELIKKGTFELPKEMQKSFLTYNELSDKEQLELINKLSALKDLPKVLVDLIKLKKGSDLEVLPNDILKKIDSYAPIESNDKEAISSFVATNKRAHTLLQPDRRLSVFLKQVVTGQQDKAEQIFTILKKEEEKQALLCKRGTITDYSGRTFNCSAYEYAYWAKDKHMCRMLEHHMDENTKAVLLKRCEAIEKDGLTYKQNGIEVKESKHFDLTPLKTVMKSYIDGYDNWYSTSNWKDMEAAFLKIGMAQRDLPAHVVNEYCRKDRSFDPMPTFNEDKLPRVSSFYNYNTQLEGSLFPLVISDTSGLGVDSVLGRGRRRYGAGLSGRGPTARRMVSVAIDLAALGHLDEVRTADLTQSRENLKPTEPELDNDSLFRIS
jgi:hypothetical protein